MEKTYDKKELKKVSLAFRQISSRLLRSNMNDADNNLKRFLEHIEDSVAIKEYFNSSFTTKYNIEEDLKGVGYRDLIPVPTKKNEEVSYVYQLMCHLKDKPNAIINISRGYGTGTKIQDHVDGLMRRVFQPLINHVNNHLENLMIDLGEDEKNTVKIEVNNSQGVNIANDGSVSNFNGNVNGNTIKILGEEILSAIPNENELSPEQQGALKDYVEYYIKEMGGNHKPNLRFTSRLLPDFKGLAEGVNLTVQTSEALQKFIEVIQTFFN